MSFDYPVCGDPASDCGDADIWRSGTAPSAGSQSGCAEPAIAFRDYPFDHVYGGPGKDARACGAKMAVLDMLADLLGRD